MCQPRDGSRHCRPCAAALCRRYQHQLRPDQKCWLSLRLRTFFHTPAIIFSRHLLSNSGIRWFSLQSFAYHLLAYDNSPYTIIFLRTFAYKLLEYDHFLYEYLPTVFLTYNLFTYTIKFLRTFTYELLAYDLLFYEQSLTIFLTYDLLTYAIIFLRTFPYEV